MKDTLSVLKGASGWSMAEKKPINQVSSEVHDFMQKNHLPGAPVKTDGVGSVLSGVKKLPPPLPMPTYVPNKFPVKIGSTELTPQLFKQYGEFLSMVEDMVTGIAAELKFKPEHGILVYWSNSTQKYEASLVAPPVSSISLGGIPIEITHIVGAPVKAKPKPKPPKVWGEDDTVQLTEKVLSNVHAMLKPIEDAEPGRWRRIYGKTSSIWQ